MNNKKFYNNNDRAELRANTQKNILENFSKTFNKIKRINETALGEDSNTYFESLSETLDAVRGKASSMNLELDEEVIWTHFGTGGISYGSTKSATIPLLKDGNPILDKRGKVANRAIRVSIYRMDSGRYELTMYKTW